MKKQIILSLVLAYLVCLNTSGQITNNGPLFAIRQNGEMGFIDATGKIVIEPKFHGALDFSEDLAVVWVRTNEAGYIDRTGAVVIDPKYVWAQPFKEGLAAVAFDTTGHGREVCSQCSPDYDWGFIDKQGNPVIPLTYHLVINFSEGLAPVVTKSHKWGFVDKTGKEVIPPQYDGAGGFSDGLALVRSGDKFGYIDHSGKIVIPMIYTEGQPFSNGVASVRVGGAALDRAWTGDYTGSSFLLIDHAGKTIFNFEGAPEKFSEGLSSYKLANDKCGYVDQRGKLVIAADYYMCEPFSEGVAIVRLTENASISRCIDKTGKTVFETTAFVTEGFRDGLARLIGFVDLSLSISDGKVGYIDKTGGIVWKPSR